MKVKKNLNEATLDDKVKEAEEVLGNTTVTAATTKGQIESELDRALKRALQAKKSEARGGKVIYPNLLFVGEAGTGKTARIKQWAEENDINLVTVLTSGMDDTDLGGVISKDKEGTGVIRLATKEMDELEEPRSVLFLDELNRGSDAVVGSLLTLIQEHIIRDDRVKGKQRKLKNFLFTIGAINPAEEGYTGANELDRALKNRFKHVAVYADPNSTKNFLVNTFKKEAEYAEDDEERLENLGRASLANTLLSNRSFRFDDQQDAERASLEGNDLLLSPRSLHQLLNWCDGTKEDFLANWNDFCNNLKKSMAERILANYQDVEDKANDVLKQDSDSQVFKKAEKTKSQMIRDRMNKVM